MGKETSIEKFIRQEKEMQPSASLSDRIMADIILIDHPSRQTVKKEFWIQTAAVAASISIAVLLGINIGKIYHPAIPDPVSWNINDSQIENLAMYELDNE